MTPQERPLEDHIARWRATVRRRRALPDLEKLERHLRDQVTALTKVGLSPDEAFMVAVRRTASLDAPWTGRAATSQDKPCVAEHRTASFDQPGPAVPRPDKHRSATPASTSNDKHSTD